ncbi:MAG: 16S rRNA (cytosine(1402)-N(4))-methyltransferase RsmH [Bacteroidetes bacterium]|nr:16S rRNA (cytosine(1402)-N(4))-methyltransferase RsmH [Bacteroidota bacterium]MBU1116562.1 16S rRNA (cytosine(1402)-N(4))-methyltransferase RsmH [Bacteroidota bacterium]MBU1797548.1 16S rRNA (cytosine(1402)-N(4))-methyltransferase RsmH [Bacteroidota bacterium]
MNHHTPVLLKESVVNLITNKSGLYFEGTIGFGGHSELILSHLDDKAKFIGTDKDSNAYLHCKNKFKNDDRVRLYNTSFTNISNISKIEFIEKYDGIFVDLGVSSFQLDDKDSGFTFREDVQLDLRMDKSKGEPASFYLNKLAEKELTEIFFKYGEERNSKKIANMICDYRINNKIKTTGQLKGIIEGITPEKYLTKALSRIFQALRIYVNNELEELEEFLNKAVSLLNKNGRLVVITFHSLEDRIVKDFLKEKTKDCICPPEYPVCVCNTKPELKIITRKPIVTSAEEIKNNKRARSAKLRVAEKI